MGGATRLLSRPPPLLLLVLSASCLTAPVTSPSSGASGRWPRCDECEAVAASIGAVLDRQRLPKRVYSAQCACCEVGSSVLWSTWNLHCCALRISWFIASSRQGERVTRVEPQRAGGAVRG